MLLIASLLAAMPVNGREPVHVAIACTSQGRLATIRVEGGPDQDASDPVDEKAFRDLLPHRKAELIVKGDEHLTYRCMGGLIYRLQRLGFSRIGFADPRPAGKP